MREIVNIFCSGEFGALRTPPLAGSLASLCSAACLTMLKHVHFETITNPDIILKYMMV